MERLNLNNNNVAEIDQKSQEPEKPKEKVFLGRTKDGAEMYDRADSHLHSEGGLTPELLETTLSMIDTGGRGFIKECVEFDRPIGEQSCVEVGPDEDVVMVYRKGRSGQTPMVKNREMEPCSAVTIVCKKDRSAQDKNIYEMLTAYVGKGSPREPWDPNLESEEERQKCEEFWRSHAIVYDDNLIDWERTKEFEFMSESAKRAELIRQRTVYTGIFIEPEELSQKIQPTLEKPILHPHVTFSFRPKTYQQINLEQLGSGAKIYAIGYGNDGKNEGLLVKIEAENPVIQSECDALKTAHITLSISKDGQAKDTANLEFTPLDEPFEINGKYGLFSQGRVINGQ